MGEPTFVAVFTVTQSEPFAWEITLSAAPYVRIGTLHHGRWAGFQRAKSAATGMMNLSGDHGGRHRRST